MRDCLGREREARRLEGGFTCPFCSAGVPAPAERCENPACPASAAAMRDPSAPERHREAIAREARRVAELEDRRREVAARLAAAEEYRRGRERRLAEVVGEARRRGACERCATRDVDRPRYVKHRAGCPRERRTS